MYYVFNITSEKCTAYCDAKLNSDILEEQGEVQIKADVVYSADEVQRLELQGSNIVLQPEAEPPKEEKLAALDTVYQSQFTALAQSLGLATLDANQTVIDGVKADYAALKAEYQAKAKEIG
ncbi:MAG: hypothetical protein ACRC7I_12355 [Selenomonadaceae bacterium]